MSFFNAVKGLLLNLHPVDDFNSNYQYRILQTIAFISVVFFRIPLWIQGGYIFRLSITKTWIWFGMQKVATLGNCWPTFQHQLKSDLNHRIAIHIFKIYPPNNFILVWTNNIGMLWYVSTLHNWLSKFSFDTDQSIFIFLI